MIFEIHARIQDSSSDRSPETINLWVEVNSNKKQHEQECESLGFQIPSSTSRHELCSSFLVSKKTLEKIPMCFLSFLYRIKTVEEKKSGVLASSPVKSLVADTSEMLAVFPDDIYFFSKQMRRFVTFFMDDLQNLQDVNFWHPDRLVDNLKNMMDKHISVRFCFLDFTLC